MKNPKRFWSTLCAGVLLLLQVSTLYGAGSIITPYETGKHVGEYMTVQGQITNVHISRTGNVFLNMGGRYPHNAFTAVIFNEYTSSFPNITRLTGKQIRVSGYIKLYRDKPEIILTNRSQIEEVR